MDSEVFDVLVIGAGLSGIAAARFYLDVHPESRVLVLEKENSIGGPWSKSRIYPGFWSQSGIRMSGFSDVPLTIPKDAETFNDIFEAKYVTEYLENYVDNHVYADQSLRKRIILKFTVTKVGKLQELWEVEGRDEDNSPKTFKTKRLIVATGTTSSPKMPSLPGADTFEGVILHQTDYGHFASQQPSKHQRVAVLGAGKSAADVVYGLVKAGNEVHWVIRKSGEGPGAFTNPADNSKGPFLNDPELAATRLFATMSPGCFTEPTYWSRFLHNTALGNKLVQGFWNSADQKCKTVGNFHNRPDALKCFHQLESSVKLFWVTGSVGMIQRRDFWDTIAQNVQVYRNDIERLENHTVVLKDGPSLPIDAMICATGFRNEYAFFNTEQRIELGLPHVLVDDEDELSWAKLEAEADEVVLQKFPKLANPPSFTLPPDATTHTTPSRLFNLIAPLKDHSIAFVGNIYVPNGFRPAEAQAIWVTALFDGTLKLPSESEMRKDIAWVNAFNKRRYPKVGRSGNYLIYDMMGYIDRSLAQVGLSSHRKGWWSDWIYPVIAGDLSGLKKEYLEKHATKLTESTE